MNTRVTGIEAVGEAPWGTHFCQFYATKKDLADILVPYFRAGLENDEFCMWVTSPPLDTREAWEALAREVPDLETHRQRGRIEIIPHTEWYLQGGRFEQNRVMQGWVDKLEGALARGCAGLRLTGNTFWLEKSAWRSFAEYEAAVDGVLGQYRMLALCTYSLDRCGAAEVADVIRNHQFALIKRDGAWELFESFDRRRLQDALAVERERLAVTLQSIGDAVIATDTEGRVRTLNRVAEELTGWSQAEACGRQLGEVFRIVNEVTGAPAEDPVRKVLERAVVVGLANHTALITRDGRRIAIADSAAPVRGLGGLLGVVLVFRDVTAERQAEQERDLTIDFLQLVNANTTTAGLIRSAAIFFQRQSGCEAVGIRLKEGDDYPYCEARGFPQRFLALESQLCARDGEGRVLRDGSGNPVIECMCGNVIRGRADPRMPFFTENGSFWTNDTTRLLATTQDADRQAHTRNRCNGEGYQSVALVPMRVGVERLGLLQLNDRRKGMFSPESIALWERLAGYLAVAVARSRAEEALLEADRRKDEFLAVLSHELRNPLAPIRNGLYILERAAPGGEQARRAHATIDRQVGHLTRLVDDLLDVTRVVRGKVQLQRDRLEFGDLVRRAVEDHRHAFVASGVRLEARLHSEAMWLSADGTRIAQVVGNLLGNAAKFTPRGGRVELTLEREAGAALLRVRDTGVGITPEELTRLFQPFAQATQTLDRSHGGLGLGLALVKGLVELHGGTVSAASNGPGQGAEFTVRVPLEPAPIQAASRAETLPFKRRRVLVIEDNVDAADSLKEVLELLGHEVQVAFDGRSGLVAAREFRPDVVLCDIGLPEMDGYEVARQLRAHDAHRDVVLVALTGYALPEDRQRVAEAGFTHHVAKPPSLEALERVLVLGVC